MICPKCKEHKFNRLDLIFLLRIGLFVVSNKVVQVKIKLYEGEEYEQTTRALLCPICKSIMKFESNAPVMIYWSIWLGFLGMPFLWIVLDKSRDHRDIFAFFFSVVGVVLFLLAIKPNLFFDYKLELVNVTEANIIK